MAERLAPRRLTPDERWLPPRFHTRSRAARRLLGSAHSLAFAADRYPLLVLDFEFSIRRPEGPVARCVSGVWHAHGRTPHRRERILPTAEVVLLLVLGPPLRMTEPAKRGATRDLSGAWLTGPHEHPILNEPLGETHVVGAVFAPGGFSAFLDDPVDSVANRIVPLESLTCSLGHGRELLAELTPCLGGSVAIEAVSRALAARLAPPADYERWRSAAEALSDPDVSTVAEVQHTLGVSRRHFADRVRRRIGLLPKSIQRIARLRRLVAELDARKPIRWSSEAVGAGYFDQPHAIREFRRFTGMTPVEYVERRRQAWGHDLEPGEAGRFVPEITR